jgi:hypothetical protein
MNEINKFQIDYQKKKRRMVFPRPGGDFVASGKKALPSSLIYLGKSRPNRNRPRPKHHLVAAGRTEGSGGQMASN